MASRAPTSASTPRSTAYTSASVLGLVGSSTETAALPASEIVRSSSRTDGSQLSMHRERAEDGGLAADTGDASAAETTARITAAGVLHKPIRVPTNKATLLPLRDGFISARRPSIRRVYFVRPRLVGREQVESH